MKKVFLLCIAAILFLNSCAKKDTEQKAIDQNLQGEWKVISTNCPEILGERNGERKKFIFRVPAGKYINLTRTELLEECGKVTPNWEIHVVSQMRYSFFPPAITKNKTH